MQRLPNKQETEVLVIFERRQITKEKAQILVNSEDSRRFADINKKHKPDIVKQQITEKKQQGYQLSVSTLEDMQRLLEKKRKYTNILCKYREIR